MLKKESSSVIGKNVLRNTLCARWKSPKWKVKNARIPKPPASLSVSGPEDGSFARDAIPTTIVVKPTSRLDNQSPQMMSVASQRKTLAATMAAEKATTSRRSERSPDGDDAISTNRLSGPV
jgi:hypothetical protein